VLQPNHIVAGRYRIVRHIADGGMGSVYEAEHLATEARVALKLLLPQMLHVAAARRRFELEARVCARVDSEHIVRVFDAGVDEGVRSPYLAMELLAGETLAARVRRNGALSPASAIEILRQVARGLDAAHGHRTAQGVLQPIVHRDLKPENLFITRRTDGTPLVKIVDFGIAKMLSDSTAVSRDVRGTPLYMAHEQVAGEAVSPQTDIWALGLLTYFMLTGRSYWPAANKATPSTEALFAQILTLPLPLPSQRLGDDGITLDAPAAFDAWLLTCIERDPSRRFGSAGVAVAALEPSLASSGRAPRLIGGGFGFRETARYEAPASPGVGSTVTSMPPVASERRREALPLARRGWLKLSGAVTIAGLVAASITWGIVRPPPRDASADAVAPPESDARGKTGVSLPPAVEVVPVEATTNAAHGAPPEVEREEPARGEAPRAAPPAPRVTVAALKPAPSFAKEVPPASPPRAPSPSPPPAGAARAPGSSGSAASAPGQKAPAAADCTFDPYTGRCRVARSAVPIAERR
jgi:tRNA A-37 threonylcarbamoyl transferase component Bud32